MGYLKERETTQALLIRIEVQALTSEAIPMQVLALGMEKSPVLEFITVH